MLRIGTFSLLLTLIALLAACGGSSSSNLPDTAPHAAAVTEGSVGYDPSGMTPGVDYLPNRLWVGIREGNEEQLALMLPIEQQGTFKSETEDMQTVMLYKALAENVAERYGAEVKFLSCLANTKWVSFEFDTDEECATALASIELDYAEYLYGAGFVPICYPTAWSPPNDPWYNAATSTTGWLWDMKKINCEPAWDLTRGNPSLRVAVVDSGILETHEELAANAIPAAQLASQITPAWRASGYWLDMHENDDVPDDNDGHGTSCAGMIAAEGNNSQTMIGVAPEVSIVTIRINDGEGFGADVGYMGIQLAAFLGSKVINCSWGHYGSPYPFEQPIINDLYNDGILVVAACGNDNTTVQHYPSDLNHVIGVGASDQADNRSSFSNYGPGVDIAAPGQDYRSTGPHQIDDYHDFGGTSGACPLVAGTAALLFAAKPSLTPDEVTHWLTTTGDPVNGFADGVQRLNVGNALEQGVGVIIDVPKPDRLIYSGIVQFTPSVIGSPDRIDAEVNGTIVGSANAAPWTINADLSSFGRGLASLDIVGILGPVESHNESTIYIDNGLSEFPMVESFESAPAGFFALEVKGYAQSLLANLKSQPPNEWTTAHIDGNGSQEWNISTDNPHKGSKLAQLGSGSTYGNWELDALISSRIDLTGVDGPTVTFQQHLNIADAANTWDNGRVLVTTDSGLTFSVAELSAGGPAVFNGYAPFWSKVELNLAAYVGQAVHLLFLFESDGAGIGAQPGEDAGWWVDSIVVSTFYNDGKPSLGTPTLTPGPAYGEVPTNWDLFASTPQGVMLASVTYKLIMPDLSELVQTATVAPYSVVFNLPDTLIGNHVLNMQITTMADAGGMGPGVAEPVYIFNQLGDTNADGLINQADLNGFGPKLGLTSTDENYIPFFDSNLDGLITESDAAAVGYYWSE